MRREPQKQAIAPAAAARSQVGATLWWQPSPQPEVGQTFAHLGARHRIIEWAESEGGWLFTTSIEAGTT